MKNVVIIGTGGHAKVIADIVLNSGDNLVGFLAKEQDKKTFLGKPILGDDLDYGRYRENYFIIAIGNADIRERIADKMNDVNWYTAIHPTAVISSMGTRIGEGTVVMANTVINPYAQIGKHSIINTNSTVEHDNIINDFVHISVGTKLAGTVTVGYKTCVGIGATISNGINICPNCRIGAGAVVVKDILETGTYIGCPARKIKQKGES